MTDLTGDNPPQRPSILFVQSWAVEHPQQPHSGGDQRLMLIQQALREIGNVTVLTARRWHQHRAAGFYPHCGQTQWACIAGAHCRDLSQHRCPHPECDVLADINVDRYDVLFVHRLAAAWWTGLSHPQRAILDLDDVPSQAFRLRARQGSLPMRAIKYLRYRRIRWSERRMLDAFRFVLVCSGEDQRDLNHPHVQVVPNSFWPSPLMDQPPLDEPPGSLLFVGSLNYRPNVQGLAWFVRDILPRIRQRQPDATLTVVGRTPRQADWSWRSAPGVHFVGTVDQVGPSIRQARVQICPLLEGGGTRIKIIESLAYGCPVVCTRIGGHGLSLTEQHGLFRCDDPESFAVACVQQLRPDTRSRAAARRGQRYVHQFYSHHIIRDRLAELIGTIVRKRCSPEDTDPAPQQPGLCSHPG